MSIQLPSPIETCIKAGTLITVFVLPELMSEPEAVKLSYCQLNWLSGFLAFFRQLAGLFRELYSVFPLCLVFFDNALSIDLYCTVYYLHRN